jgi:UDP:flavonoid glycosyltransferase YjiC (YdhE family)
MARILFRLLEETGHILPSMKLAKGLAARGHRVAYHVSPELESILRRNGIAVVARSTGRSRPRPASPAYYGEMLPALGEQGTMRRELLDFAPDLAVVDNYELPYALAARSVGCPLILLSTHLPQTVEGGIPPITTRIPWRPGATGHAIAALAWTRHLGSNWARERAKAMLGRSTSARLLREAVSVFGGAPNALETRAAILPQLRDAPELVACPPQFDFPRAQRDGRTYVESIDLDREEPGELPALDGRPLVFCSMGTQGDRTASVVVAFLRKVVDALAGQDRFNGIVVHGSGIAREDLGAAPAHVVVTRTVPQLAALRRAAIMITHGGLGSVKECVAEGVPMNVYPLGWDQPGNGARVVHHRLGRMGSVSRASPASILAMIDDTLSSSLRSGEVRESFRAFEGERRGVARIESLITGRSCTNSAAAAE